MPRPDPGRNDTGLLTSLDGEARPWRRRDDGIARPARPGGDSAALPSRPGRRDDAAGPGRPDDRATGPGRRDDGAAGPSRPDDDGAAWPGRAGDDGATRPGRRGRGERDAGPVSGSPDRDTVARPPVDDRAIPLDQQIDEMSGEALANRLRRAPLARLRRPPGSQVAADPVVPLALSDFHDLRRLGLFGDDGRNPPAELVGAVAVGGLDPRERSRLARCAGEPPLDRERSLAAVGGDVPDRAAIALPADEVVAIRRDRPRDVMEATGGPVDELSFALALYGDDLDPDDVSRRLGCEPTSARRRGEAPPGRAWPRAGSDASRTYATGTWLLEVRGEPPVLADDLVETLLRQFPSEPPFWQSLHHDFRVQLRLGVYTARWHRSFSLSTASLARCAATGAPLRFDLYVYDCADS